MGERVMADIPQWAKERAIELADAEDWEKVPALATAFARYIAEHEDPPVDPLLIEAREICALDCEKFRLLSSAGNYRRGVNDKGDTLRVVITALKRGIELGKQP
jgi:hypothetical protein